VSADTEVHSGGSDAVVHAHADVDHAHPSDLTYIKVGAVLFVVTALEVATYAVGMSGAALLLLLFPMMTFKFGVVAAYFMHLKFDSKLFRRFFITGIVLAVGVYMIVMLTLHVFD